MKYKHKILLALLPKSSSIYLTLATFVFSFLPISASIALPLSRGDRLEVSIPDEPYFSRVYEVNEAGNLEIPYLGALPVAGLEPLTVERKLIDALVAKEFFPPDTLQLTVQVLEWSPIRVNVAGELFQPGVVLINPPLSREESATAINTNQITGEFPYRRTLTDAIEGAGGVLPTANIREIRLIRDGREQVLDLTGVFTGEPFENVSLIEGDRIIVPAAASFQAELVRPSKITLSGIKVFVSNLIVPANNNSSAGVGNLKEGIDFPYGSRFSHAVISMNCAGGTDATNAKRRAILVRTNRLTGETFYLERGVEELMRDSHNNDDNPFLMPRDGVACYDSLVTNTHDIFTILGDIINPFKGLF